jgi:transmembrane sensor
MADETSPGDQPSYGELLELYLRGEAMKVELELLFAYFRKQPVEAARLMIMASRQRPAAVVGQGELDPELSRKMLRRLLTDIRQTSERKEAVVVELPSQRRRVGWLVAAVLIGLLGTGTWWVLRSRQTSNPAVAVNAGDVAAPTRNRATITLGSGQQVDLDSAAAGALAAQDGAKIVKDANGHIVYKVDIDHPGALIYNTLNNPRGSQVVSLTLSDGTRVWLNAASSIRYPAAFLANERVVEITGEAYFEVAEDATKPFTVRKDNTVIEVLGTAFNVNSYGDEPVLAVTLLSGKVRVDVSGTDQVLDPGEQANVKDDG